MRYLILVVGAISLSLAMTAEVGAAGSPQSHCVIADVDPLNTPHMLVSVYTAAAQQTQSDNRGCAYYGRGLIYQLGGKSDEAIADYTRAIGWIRTVSEPYAARGDVYGSQGDNEKAKADYAEAAELDQNDATALNDICWERAKRGYPLALALSDCDSALKLRPDQWFAWDSRCLVNYRLGNYAAAISDCSKSLELWRDATGLEKIAPHARAGSLYVRGLAKIKNGDHDGGDADIAAAKDQYERVAEKYALYGVSP